MSASHPTHKSFWIIIFAFLVACGQQTVTPPTETPAPAVALPTTTPTPTSIPFYVTPSPLPAEPSSPFITPDAAQIARWKEYEDALATRLFSPKYNPRSPSEFLCEWEILGQSDLEVYVWAACMSIFPADARGNPYFSMMPVLIHIEADGAVRSMVTPGGGADFAPDIREMFSLEAQEKYFGNLVHKQDLIDHLWWRREHTEELPLIVLFATPNPLPTSIPLYVTPSPLPTEPIVPVIIPDAIQVERWRDYEDALAKSLLPNLPREDVLCEWEILGRSDVEVYIWVKCMSVNSVATTSKGTDIFLSSSTPAVIHLEIDGTIQNVAVPGAGSDYSQDIRNMFPLDVQERIFNDLISYGRLSEHIEKRRMYPDMPPLIVFLATPTP